MFALLIPLSLVAIIAFAIAASIEGKNTMKKSSIIRSLYFYLASLITLAITVGALIFLVNLGLKSWVFTKADAGPSTRIGSPPALMFDTGVASPTDKIVPYSTNLSCTGTCTLTDAQKTSISNWKTSYQNWIEASANPGSQRARDAVVALSFLLVAAPFFFIHFRTVQRDARENQEGEHSVIRPVYFYFVSLASLIMMVIAGGFLINLVLKTWVFPSAGQADIAAQKVYSSPSIISPDVTSVQSLVTCGTACGLDAETISLATRWPQDNEQTSTTNNNTQRQAATAIPFVLVGIPLFWYHWTIVRKEAKGRTNQGTATPSTTKLA